MSSIAFWIVLCFILLWVTYPYIWAFHIPYFSQEKFDPEYLYTISHLGRIKDQDKFDQVLREKQLEGKIIIFPPNYNQIYPRSSKVTQKIETLEIENIKLRNKIRDLTESTPEVKPVVQEQKTETNLESINFN